MTSSFGTVIGTPRDKLPNMGDTNYDRTSPDLADAVNKEIDKNIADTKDFFSDMMKIEELRYKNRDDNIKALASFAKSAAEFKKVSEQAEEVAKTRRKYNTRDDEIEQARAERAEKELDGETTKATGQLLADNKTESFDMVALLTRENIEDKTIKDFNTEDLAFGSINSYTNKNDWFNKATSIEGEEVWDKGEDLWLITLYDRYEQSGGNTQSRQWQRHMNKYVFPELAKRKEKAMLEWEAVQRIKIRSNLNNKVDNRIRDDLAAGEGMNTAALLKYVKDANQYNTDAEALQHIADYIYTNLTNKTGNVSLAMADDFKSLFKFKHSGTNKETTLQDSNFGKNGSLTASLIARVERGIKNAIEDPDDLLPAKMQRFENDVVTPYRDENGDISDKDQLTIAAEWRKQFPDKPFSQSILSEGVKSHTGNKFGSSYGKYSVPGQPDILADYKTDLQDVVIAKYKDLDVMYSRNQLPGGDNRAIEKAYAALKRRVEQSEVGNQGLDFGTRVGSELEVVKAKLANGDYDVVVPTYSTGTAQDVIDTADYFTKPGNRTSSNFASALEKANLETSRVALNDGNFGAAITPFWVNTAKRLGVAPEKLLSDRLIATGGIDPKTGDIVNSNEIYKLSKDDLYELHRNPNAHSSIDVFYKVNEETGEKNSTIMLNAARLRKSDGSGFIDDGYYTLRGQGVKKLKRINNTLTPTDLLRIGADDVGRYGISKAGMKEALTYKGAGTKPILEGLLNKPFTEDSQSQVMALLWHIRLQKQNAIRGVEIDGNVFWRLSGITDVEQAALEEFMPALKDAPYSSRPHVIQEDVMSAIINEIPTPIEKEKPKPKKRSRR